MTASQIQAPINVPTGPAGRAMAEPMSAEMLDLMEAHLNLERQSAADYLAAAIWFAERELTGFAEHLRDEAKQEEQHAAKFADYLISRGQRPVLDTIEPPRQQWTGVEQVIANVFRMESDVTASVLQLYGTAEKDIDRRSPAKCGAFYCTGVMASPDPERAKPSQELCSEPFTRCSPEPIGVCTRAV
ncbi:ferritin [Synechococcus sp. BIOS-E4-1]|uniref:ferritin n=1 Tax=Synechococcus sp. BIOS-E4-1 TaxID=1400864 RepID=UPI001644CBEE|nr:ferritin [Synechococcus sp. BIOS-E4-1]QNI53631.1 ferritin [Synechococcus sp. BIOS-E4-1]